MNLITDIKQQKWMRQGSSIKSSLVRVFQNIPLYIIVHFLFDPPRDFLPKNYGGKKIVPRIWIFNFTSFRTLTYTWNIRIRIYLPCPAHNTLQYKFRQLTSTIESPDLPTNTQFRLRRRKVNTGLVSEEFCLFGIICLLIWPKPLHFEEDRESLKKKIGMTFCYPFQMVSE